MCKWFTESNRWKHFVLGIPEGIISWMLAIGTANGMEIKDCHHDSINKDKPIYKWNFRSWDWLDWFMTVAGGFIGTLIRLGVLWLLFPDFMHKLFYCIFG